MDILLDDPIIENQFQEILSKIKRRKNGVVADNLKERGLTYKMNWGVSVIDLKLIAKEYSQNHLLALKLWNKQWRETIILASMLDEPKDVSENQMDYWTKSFENIEVAEHIAANLWVHSKFAFVKALEWCRGKKHIVKYTGIHLMGRLAMVDKNAIDEMFEPFFEEFHILAKDPKLYHVIFRALTIVGNRSEWLLAQMQELVNILQESESENATKLGEELAAQLGLKD